MKRRFVRILVAMLVLGVLAGVAMVAVLSIEQSSEIELPAPTGPFAVGRMIYDWRDETTVDSAAPKAGTKREIMAWIWYPATARQPAIMDDYIPANMRTGPNPIPFRWVYRDVSKVHAHSIRNADLQAQHAYPVVIFRAGASAGVAAYTTLAEDLTSHGYIVVGIDAPYRTGRVVFPDGRFVTRTAENDLEEYSDEEAPRVATKLMMLWTADMTFALDRLAQLNASDPSGKFTGRLDMSHIGAFGHSFGGAQAAQFCHDDARCTAAVDIDGRLFGSVIKDGMRKPFMFLISRDSRGGAGDGSTTAEIREIMADMQSLYNRLPRDSRQWLFLLGANHFLYNDAGSVLTSNLVKSALRLLGVLQIEGRRQIAVTTYCVHTFFDAHLKGVGAQPLKLVSPVYPELQSVD